MNLSDKTFEEFSNKFFGYDQQFNDDMGNLNEYENYYILQMSVPSFNKEEININVDGGVIKIGSNIERNKTIEGELRVEYSKQPFEKAYHLPNNVNTDDISAEMENGILGIRLGKNIDETSSKSIDIK